MRSRQRLQTAPALAFSGKAVIQVSNPKEDAIMPIRLRKFIGTFIILALVVLYALVATTVATYRLAESAWYVHLLYFLFTGLLWVVPAMFVIRWMEGPAKKKHS